MAVCGTSNVRSQCGYLARVKQGLRVNHLTTRRQYLVREMDGWVPLACAPGVASIIIAILIVFGSFYGLFGLVTIINCRYRYPCRSFWASRTATFWVSISNTNFDKYRNFFCRYRPRTTIALRTTALKNTARSPHHISPF